MMHPSRFPDQGRPWPECWTAAPGRRRGLRPVVRAIRRDAHPQRLTVVLLDDEPCLRLVLGMVMRWDPRVRVVEHRDGWSAMRCLRGSTPDLVISDMNHEGPDGLMIAETLRRCGLTMPVFIVSGTLCWSEDDGFRARGATASLPKPFTLNQFLRVVRRLLVRRTCHSRGMRPGVAASRNPRGGRP